jgi:hypothetical protein
VAGSSAYTAHYTAHTADRQPHTAYRTTLPTAYCTPHTADRTPPTAYRIKTSTNMEYLGLLFEVLLFGLGLYVYLFSRGFVKAGDPAIMERAEAFRRSNGWWMRLAGLALMAVMGANIVLHVMDMMKR